MVLKIISQKSSTTEEDKDIPCGHSVSKIWTCDSIESRKMMYREV